MKLTTFTSTLLSTSTLVAAAPHIRRDGQPSYSLPDHCISQSQAETLVQRYSAIIAQQPSDLGDPVTTAQQIIASGYTEQSDSANFFLDIPYGKTTVPSKSQFIQLSQSQTPATYDTKAVYITQDCSQILWQWVDPEFDGGLYHVQGFHLFTINEAGLLTHADFEFNSVAAALDTGFEVMEPDGTVLPPAGGSGVSASMSVAPTASASVVASSYGVPSASISASASVPASASSWRVAPGSTAAPSASASGWA